ncbi:hypothetical protein [Ruegeria sediminis]|nr:hypothetical protein [Ruegeria sediminis]
MTRLAIADQLLPLTGIHNPSGTNIRNRKLATDGPPASQAAKIQLGSGTGSFNCQTAWKHAECLWY